MIEPLVLKRQLEDVFKTKEELEAEASKGAKNKEPDSKN